MSALLWNALWLIAAVTIITFAVAKHRQNRKKINELQDELSSRLSDAVFEDEQQS